MNAAVEQVESKAREFAGEERQMRVESVKIAIFATFARYIFRTFISKAAFIILC